MKFYKKKGFLTVKNENAFKNNNNFLLKTTTTKI